MGNGSPASGIWQPAVRQKLCTFANIVLQLHGNCTNSLYIHYTHEYITSCGEDCGRYWDLDLVWVWALAKIL